MAKVYSVKLDVKSLDKLQKKVQRYQSTFDNKCKQFLRELAKVGIPVIDENMAQASFTYNNGIQSGSNTEHSAYVRVYSKDGQFTAVLTLKGQEVLFIEFGAGTYYNGSVGSSPHPKGQENGFLIGTYGMGHGSQKVWGYYDDDGKLALTHGTKATMPMLKAGLEIREQVISIAKSVFGS